MSKYIYLTDIVSSEILEDSDWRTSKMGYKFNFNHDKWPIDGSIVIYLGSMRGLDGATREGLRKALCRYAEELSAGTVKSVLGAPRITRGFQ